MAENVVCKADRVRGTPICTTHKKPLVDRRTFDSLNKKTEHPPVGDLICPESGTSFAFPLEVDEFLKPSR